MSNWTGFKYEAVGGLIERIQRRALRAQRKVMRALFIEKGALELAVRAKALRDNSRLWCDRKIAQFKRIYDAYVKLVTGGAQAATDGEAAHLSAAGAVDVSGA